MSLTLLATGFCHKLTKTVLNVTTVLSCWGKCCDVHPDKSELNEVTFGDYWVSVNSAATVLTASATHQCDSCTWAPEKRHSNSFNTQQDTFTSEETNSLLFFLTSSIGWKLQAEASWETKMGSCTQSVFPLYSPIFDLSHNCSFCDDRVSSV